MRLMAPTEIELIGSSHVYTRRHTHVYTYSLCMCYQHIRNIFSAHTIAVCVLATFVRLFLAMPTSTKATTDSPTIAAICAQFVCDRPSAARPPP